MHVMATGLSESMGSSGSERRVRDTGMTSAGNLEHWRREGRVEEEVLESLVRLTQHVANARTYEEIFEIGADEIARFYDYDRCTLVVNDRQNRSMRIDYVRSPEITYTTDGTWQFDTGTVAGWVVTHAEPLIHQIGPEDRFTRDEERRQQGVKELVSLPLMIEGEAVAALTLSTTKAGTFHEDDLWILRTLVDHLSVAAAATNLRQQAERRAQVSTFLAEVSAKIASVQDVNSILHDVLKTAEPVLGDLQVIYRIDQVEGEIHFQTLSCSTERLARVAEPIFRDRSPTERGAFIGPATQGKTIFIPDLRTADISDSARLNSERIGALSVIALPLRAGGALLGAYVTARTIDSLLEGTWEPFSEDDLRLAQNFSDRLAAAFLNQRLHDETRQTLAVSESLLQIGQELSSSVDLDQIFSLVTNFAWLLLNADYAAIAAEDAQGAFAWRAIVGNQTNAHESARFIYGQGMVGRIAQTRETMIIEGFPDNPAFPPETLPVHAAERMRTTMGLPLRAGDHVFGALIVGYRHPHSISQTEVRFGEALANQAAIALENARLYANAKAAIDHRDHFMSITAHELQTPLTALHGRAQLLDRRLGDQLDPQDAEAIQVVLRQSERLSRMVNDLLDISRLGSGRLSLARATIDIVALTRQLIEEANVGPDLTPIRFLPEVDTLMISIDGSRFEQVIANLLANAKRFAGTESEIFVTVRKHLERVLIEVKDQGFGIAESHLERIFEPFFQVDPVPNGGVGLGLAICRQIIANHGGSIWATSPGRGLGSTFTISLPLQD
jgi:signal transduction histidine kinase